MKNEEFSYALLSNAFILNNKSFSKESNAKLFTIHYLLFTDSLEQLQ